MPDSQICLNARALLAEIEPLKQRFDLAYERCKAMNAVADKAEAVKALALVSEKIEVFKQTIFLDGLERVGMSEQYRTQVALLKEAGFAIDWSIVDDSGKLADTICSLGIDAQPHVLPTFLEIISHMREKIEDWMVACITHLNETGALLDDTFGVSDSGIALVGSYSTKDNAVPYVFVGSRSTAMNTVDINFTWLGSEDVVKRSDFRTVIPV